MRVLSCVLLTLVFALSPPALTSEQRNDLATARDDADHREQAFYAVVQHVRTWNAPPAAGGVAIRVEPDFQAMRQRPAEFRGELCRIEGELLQQTTLAPPYEDVSEWFIRETRSGNPVMAYVVRDKSTPAPRSRSIIRIDGLFYKRLRFAARDGRARDYPAFIGRFPVLVASFPSPSATLPGSSGMRGLDLLSIVAGPVALLMIVFVGLRMWITRKRTELSRTQRTLSQVSTRNATNGGAGMDDDAGLPQDPAAALAELRRRAVDTEE